MSRLTDAEPDPIVLVVVFDDRPIVAVPAQSAPSASEVAVYDFGRPATLSREHTRALELAFETFARQWGPLLSSRVRGRAQVSFDAVALQSCDEYTDALPATTVLAVGSIPGTDRRVLLQFPLSAATAWIVQMLGGRADSAPTDRVLTPLEQALLQPLLTDSLEQLGTALGGLLPAGTVFTGVQFSSQYAQSAAVGEPVLVASLTLRFGGRAVAASVMLPVPDVIAGLSETMPTGDASGLLRAQVEQTPVEVALRLAPLIVQPHTVLDLSIGDVISLPHDSTRPLDLMLDGLPVASAAVGVSGARLACIVTATASASRSPEETE